MPQNNPANNNDQTALEKRFVGAAVDISQDLPGINDIGFMPAGLCQTFFPYKDPGDQVSFWSREQGRYTLSIAAIPRMNPETKQPENLGIPFGPKPRLLLAVLNSIALKQKNPEMYLGNSLTEFIGDYLKLSTDGRTIRTVKEQMARLAAADVQMSYRLEENHTYEEGMKIIRGLDLWWTKSKNQRHFWGNYLRFSDDYFNILQEHGVPLDLRALAAVSNKPMAIDLYWFLAHRLHSLKKPVAVTWKAFKDQFGFSYERMDLFKRDFRKCASMVKAIYPDARFEEIDNQGFVLYQSKPPVPGKIHVVVPPVQTLGNPFGHLPKRTQGRGPSKAEMRQMKTELDQLNAATEAKLSPQEKAQRQAAQKRLVQKRKDQGNV